MKRAQPEAAIQRAICRHLELRSVGGLVWFAVPNQGARNPRSAAILKGLGVKAGVSDLILLHAGTAYALELKVGKNKQTDSQKAFADAFVRAGGKSACVWNIDDALDVLLGWSLIH